MRFIGLVTTVLGALCLPGSGAHAAPWCAHFNTGLNDCNFNSFQQCMVALSGNGGYCAHNPFESPYRTGAGWRRGYSRSY
jgi:hypothetical protein